jgi:cellulose synthase/poly-beta-1,6-N-acetylglucosamine synthase-like glycosyltransferase
LNPDPLALAHQRPELSAVTPFWRSQIVAIASAAVLFLLLGLWKPLAAGRLFVAIATVLYILISSYKLLLIYCSVRHDSEIRIPPAELDEMDESGLPVFSLLIPLYHESESVGSLVRSLCRLDYPREKLDIQLLLEEDDSQTRDAVAAVALPAEFRCTVVPVSQPRTKPKACNIGLAFAKGEFLVIYDAEDQPEPDQLKKAVAAFRRCGPEVVCLQSKLNFYNPRQNVLTRFFSAEYSAWFDLSLPGLASLHAVIPLGGTSNHFRTGPLRELLGWDAYNVAEDCDLGVRICRHGWTTRMLDTTTWEEACSDYGFWIRQRTRWFKGYMQAWFVHTRQPVRLVRELGFRNTLHFLMLIGGMLFCLLANPVFWTLTACWFVRQLQSLDALYPPPVFLMGAFCLFLGNFAFVYAGALGCYRRRYFDLVKFALLMPPYWFFMSIAAWRALGQLITNPFKWEKTRHGLTGKKT